ncbi:hypothetical protein [Aliivibrio fischeri]|uniref:hypothetical protein n=1 Tax=Aliivibrio fischeri TaxID=668 RepID=UPI00084CA381|nr:hypothetical protein [Aliivibrio fischeri]OED53045.1 hypothetical protein BEI47_18350 [Aliivibrio fischeri]
MSQLEFSGVKIKEILDVRVSNGETNFSLFNSETQRQLAVVSALELIKADLSSAYSTGGTSSKSSYSLEKHMQSLSDYADCILDAMNNKDD